MKETEIKENEFLEDCEYEIAQARFDELRNRNQIYLCRSCGVESDGRFFGRDYPTCNCCDSDILENI